MKSYMHAYIIISYYKKGIGSPKTPNSLLTKQVAPFSSMFRRLETLPSNFSYWVKKSLCLVGAPVSERSLARIIPRI